MGNANIFPGWEIVEPIGSGGFSKVYKIRKADSSRAEFLSALKIIDIPHSPDEYNSYRADGYDDNSITQIFDEQVKEIVQEFELMHQFRGVTNVVSYEDHLVIQNDNGIGWKILIRMELLQTLPDWYMCHSMKDSDVKQLGIDICRALKLCEQKNIVHRDIKPQNIFANAFDDFKLGDFGVARVMEHTLRATKIGTYTYMAPEVYNGQPYNYISDIYSLGMVLYWLLNDRRLPFLPLPPAVPTPTMNNEAQMRRLNGEAIPAPKYGSDELKAVVLKACAYDPKDRYASAEEFMKALQSAECGGIICNPSVAETLAPVEDTGTEIMTGVDASGTVEPSDDVTVSIFHASTASAQKTIEEIEPVTGGGTDDAPNSGILFGNNLDTESMDDEKTVSVFFDNSETVKPQRELVKEQGSAVQPEIKEAVPVTEVAQKEETPAEDKKSKLWLWISLLAAMIVAIIIIAMSCGHKHTPNGRMKSYDDNYHWDVCECGEKINKSYHEYDSWYIEVEPTETETGTGYHVCGTCNNTKAETIPALGNEGDVSDSPDNSDVSEDQDVSTDVSVDVSTDISTDVSTDVSTDTSADVSETPDTSVVPDVSETHTHSYSSGWKSNETSHWKVCDCGEKNTALSHDFGSWTTTKKATETTTGSKERTCNTCGYKETAKIPVLFHVHSYSSSWKNNGSSHWTVCDCGEKNSLASHTYSAWKTTKSATCTTAGSKYRTCTVCGYKETATISATGSHSYGSWTITKSSTCVNSGKEQRTCSVCGKVETISIPPTGTHSYNNGSCVDCGRLKPSEGLSYVQNDSGYTVSQGSCTDSYVIIPDSYGGMPVNEIDDYAFSYSSMDAVYIPDSVTRIGTRAFECTNLTEIIMPDSVTSMGAYTFAACYDLQYVSFSDSLKTIPGGAFYLCGAISDISWGASIEMIGNSSFWGCNSLTTVTIPDSVLYLDDWAFAYCENLTNVYLSNNLKQIRKKVFYDCYNLDPMDFPRTLYFISDYAFSGCTNFGTVIIPSSVTQIGSFVFERCDYMGAVLCEAASKPAGWAEDWLDGCPADVYWDW